MPTITLYKNTKLDGHKNYVIDDIETYLTDKAAYTSQSTFQYQRYELNKFIKMNLPQKDQGNATASDKYDYMKIVDGDNIYYYFIIRISQKAQSTIEFECHMDVLNTFHYSDSVGNKNYTLTDRTLVTREHKDRWKKWVRRFFESTELTELELNTKYVVNPEGTSSVLIYYADIVEIINDRNEVVFNFDDIPNPQNIALYWDSSEGKWQLYYESMFIPHYIDLESNERVIITITDGANLSYVNTQLADGELGDFAYVVFFTETYVEERLVRIIDRFQEGIEAYTFKNDEITLYDEDKERHWYVAYSSANAVVQNPNDTQATYVNPVQVDFIGSDGYISRISILLEVIVYPEQLPKYSNVEEWLRVQASDFSSGGYVKINGTTYMAGTDFTTLWIEKKNNYDLTFRRVVKNFISTGTIIAENVRSISFYKINQCELYTAINDGMYATFETYFYIGSDGGVGSRTSKPFREFDLTDSKLIKVIAYPYCPRGDLAGFTSYTNLSDELVWNSNLDCLELKNGQVNGFDRVIEFEITNPFSVMQMDIPTFGVRQSRNALYESKLYHSDYYIPKFVYDSFAFGFRNECLDIEKVMNNISLDKFNVRYVCSGNVQSKFMFQFNDYICDKKEVQDYNNVLVVERNNEKALFNNAYINYIRSGGFRYDTKNADTQKMTDALMITLSTIGAIGSFVSTPATGPKGVVAGVGLLVGAATKTISAITSAQQNDRAIAQKMTQLANQSTSVSTSEDIDILTAYSGNKAKLCYYQVNDLLRNALWDLFHFFGYKTNEYKIPVVNTRCNFNFIQAEIVFDEFNFNEDIANEIMEKWSQGVTFFHKQNETVKYDIEQQYENFETSLLED